MENSFSREMGFTRDEFFRVLPSALNGRSFKQDAAGITVDVNQGSVRIDVGEQQVRKIASFSLPFIKVDFAFENFNAEQIEEFMNYFDLRYQRGGG